MSAATTLSDNMLKDALFLRGDEEATVWGQLLAPECIEETVSRLTNFATSVNNDLAVRAAKQNGTYSTDYAEWRSRALGFKAAVDRKLHVAKAQLKTQRRSQSLEQALSARTTLRELSLAVLEHQRASHAAEIRAERHDEELWAALDRLCVPVNDDLLPLRYLITEGVWS